MEYRASVDERDLTRLVAALNAESDGRALRRDLRRDLRTAVEPAAAAAQASILSMGVGGLTRAQPSLRTVVAAAVKVEVRTGVKRAGVAVVVKKHTMPRGFWNAPKRLNSRRGWRHPVRGTDAWVTQRGKPGWFDDTLEKAKPSTVRAAKAAMDGVARRISMKTRG